ncbi:cucumisin [Phtheirospermum japonicum]|uniref:Cucumisin n=1 Tax=Phtheirospermum japonicum TaxID=374723 RepID=A0A830DC50_9LAMI|nr:cucumisin [Phtheirospermum japonicum]
MRATATTSTCHGGAFVPHRPSPHPPICCSSPRILRQPYDHKHNWKPMRAKIEVSKICKLCARANAKATSDWNAEPYEASHSRGKYYLDEQDVVTFLDPPKDLIPLDPSSYNPASYLWKKIDDIPVERRHNLLSMLNPRLISRAWEVAGGRYDDPKLANKSASSLLSDINCAGSLELWRCQTSGAPLQIAWMNTSQKVIFGCSDGKAYGRLIGGYPLSGIINSVHPLYFSVGEINEVMSTEEPCDLAYEFGDGLLNLPEYPQEFLKPEKHPWPFNDQVVIYVRHVGPGVMVGQAWQEGKALEQVPKKLCSEILMVYIVYMGALPEGDNSKYSLSSYHIDMLEQVVDKSFLGRSLIRSYTRSFNAFAANLTLEEKEKLASLEEVVSIFPSGVLRTQTTRSWDFMRFHENVHREHQRESDVIVGVIDTGVWPESQSFDDQGFGPIPSKWKGECKGGKNFTCNRKLIGARYYETSNSTRDTNGHGTHTASTAVGRSVKHANFYGLGKGTARGGAPSARFAAYQACNPLCLVVDVLASFDDAIADGVDIISISIGYWIPLDFTFDPIAIGAFHAMRKGILTVQAAGNNGPTPGLITSVAPWVFTVAASSIDRRFFDKVTLGDGQGDAINTFKRDKKVSFPLVYGKDASRTCSELKAQHCEVGCLNSSLVKNKIVVCDNLAGSTEAYLAGAAGIIKKNDRLLPSFVVPFPESWLAPSKFAQLLDYINSTKHAGKTPKAYISPTETIKDRHAPEVAQYSARGPNPIVPDILKPDVAAPGTDILAAYSPAARPSLNIDKRSVNFIIISGTSMACPHVTGAAAYVKTFHPNLSPSAIKSALMTTAKPWKSKNITNAEFGYGAGHINPVKAVNPGLVYDISTHDYIIYLCELGYNTSTVRKITGDNSSCPKDSELKKTKYSKLNYPTIAANVKIGKAFKVRFLRTVTNVGHAKSRYKVKIVKSLGGRVVVRPRVIKFRALNQRRSFVVTVSGKISEKLFVASIVWSDGKHKVRSPIVVYDDSVSV